MNVIRECLKLDPEHKDCYPFYKKVKKVAKFLIAAQEAQNNQDWQECIDASQKILKNEPKVSKVIKKYLHTYIFPFGQFCHKMSARVEKTRILLPLRRYFVKLIIINSQYIFCKMRTKTRSCSRSRILIIINEICGLDESLFLRI